MNKFTTLALIAAVAVGATAIKANAAPLTKSEIDALPCSGPPAGPRVDVIRQAYIIAGVSLEHYALGHSNSVAEAAGTAAAQAAADEMAKGIENGDRAMATSGLCAMHDAQHAELVRQQSTESPEERARVEEYTLEATERLRQSLSQQ